MSTPPHCPIILTEETVREPLRARLASRSARLAPEGAGTASAVLAAMCERDGEVCLWLMRRTIDHGKHSGQVALPGGKRDPSDGAMLDTALREAEEEIGLARASVDVLGRLDDLVTGTGFSISPFVAWVSGPFEPRPSPAEVARVFAAPLRAFFRPPRGEHPFYGYDVDGELVWGATGRIVFDLVRTLLAAM
jgi:8-oxo-dGTP pyrophosphatase MutT (NUDIX family)